MEVEVHAQHRLVLAVCVASVESPVRSPVCPGGAKVEHVVLGALSATLVVGDRDGGKQRPPSTTGAYRAAAEITTPDVKSRGSAADALLATAAGERDLRHDGATELPRSHRGSRRSTSRSSWNFA